jgi:hypothetical protein
LNFYPTCTDVVRGIPDHIFNLMPRSVFAFILVAIGFLVSSYLARLLAGKGGFRKLNRASGSLLASTQDALKKPVIEAEKGIPTSNVTAQVLDALRKEGIRPSTDQQEEELSGLMVSMIVGEASCNDICTQTNQGTCARDWFAHIDNCVIAQAAFPSGRCSESSSPDVPALVRSGVEQVLVSTDKKGNPPSCNAKPKPGVQRLCACVPKVRARQETKPGLEAVRDVVRKELIDAEITEKTSTAAENRWTTSYFFV